MLMWCLSGVVMLFVHYPSLDEGRRVEALQPIAWTSCCRWPQIADDMAIESATLENLAGAPVLRVRPAGGPEQTIDLGQAQVISHVTDVQAQAVAAGFGSLRAQHSAGRRIDQDQWTVSGEFKRHRPLHLFALADPPGTQIYVSDTTGQAVQLTTASGRFWNWLGAVPHWLYPTLLRRNPALWTQVVIWTSLLGVFLTLTGLYVGWAAFRPYDDRRWSAYRRVWLWHHVAGLVFGVLTLAWILSGLVSMNPWGFLDGDGDGSVAARLTGPPHAWRDVRTVVQRLAASPPDVPVVQAEITPFAGRLYILIHRRSGAIERLDAGGRPAPMTAPDLAAAAGRIAGGTGARGLMTREDAYYFSHHETARLPVYRVIQNSGERDYLDPRTGELVAAFGADARGYRWLHQALHRGDFIPGMRRGPAWAAAMLLLLAGVTFGVATGVWLGCKAVWRDVRRSIRRS